MSDYPDIPDIPADVQVGEWLRGSGAECDVAVCTRVRFARNVQGYRFATHMSKEEARDLTTYLAQEIHALRPDLRFVDISAVDDVEREVMIERHLISRELAEIDRPRAALIDDLESVSIMLNEEDHLRSQTFRSGFQVEAAYAAAEEFDDALLEAIPLAFSEDLGFLTSCPTNTGTGLRVSVMLHFPGLVWAGEMERAMNAAQKIHHAVRGLYGEGSRALGDFYQVSNQVTLGRDERRIAADVQAAVGRMIQLERQVRGALLEGEARSRTTDRIFRALGTLENARILSSEECLESLSAVRFGVQQGLVPDVSIADLNLLVLIAQPAHLQRVCGLRLPPAERDARRAHLVRRILRRGSDRTSDNGPGAGGG